MPECRLLLISDLDGTLLGGDSRVSTLSGAIISDLTRRGAMISVATARTPATVEPLLSGIATTPPAIVMTGCSLWERGERRFLNPHLFAPGLATRTAAEFVAYGVNPFVYTLTAAGRIIVYHNGGGLTRAEDNFYQERRGLELKRFVFNTAEGYAAAFEGTMLLLGIGDTESVGALATALQKRSEISISAFPDIFNPRISYIEVFAEGVSKAQAVLDLKALTGAERVVVYGDNLNDLSMMRVADESVAVANARPEVLEAASRVIGPNTSDSVALDMASLFKGAR